MDLEIYDNTKAVTQAHLELIKKITEFAGNYMKLPEDTEMSVTLMHNDEIHQINKEYRDTDRATDVISFAIEEDPDDQDVIILDPEMQIPRNIGDLMISVDKVAEQANDYGHSFERELGYTVVHGFLHLNGYDHMRSAEDEKVMFALQRKILDAYGLKR
ncbi:rRNA maturation RNase YbeY [Loigolactobacillus backii]|uniref:Endoribonuclease YbeY n=1 Tax=Loigolactobacillus backii TaxID=375175 RepID=A0A192H4D5_9LACO|nr:rRNA maturation RNase YbeY [Loigolactobacillus backii]ANK59597.1 rRNA maturation factor [Loigolactobacillus backii]ANK62836.1 rRNA maturation factor [Loigolactobacillus backii]ANK64591.1 rRNA maturation factor [Loigolactobacillus backii]ANK67013.1 rRNA maturation factor [Loigolactobacillus backii]ANK70156.1 rRNA maturation factor [Loigolactobacillus backii]